MSKNVSVYIDGANLHRGSTELGHPIDYKKFRGWLRQKFGVTKAYLFIGLIPSRAKLYEYLQESGYILIFKETVTHSDGQVKGNCDAELVLKVVTDFFERATDACVLVTGDGDFRCLVEFLIERKMNVSVLAPNRSKCSILLKRTAAPIVCLTEHYHKFKREIRPKNEKTPDADVSA
jgi:uncharacterized LabA/DUF88 family protein